MSMTALAGWEQEGTNWKYNDNGTYAINGWKWIDGNNDGIAESYYCDNNGILARDTTVEGYTVNSDGAWIVEGKIQTQGVAADIRNAGATNAGSYDLQSHLAGMLDQLGLNFAKDSNGVDMLYWSSQYQNRTNGYDAGPEVRWQKSKETNNLGYYYGVGHDYDIYDVYEYVNYPINRNAVQASLINFDEDKPADGKIGGGQRRKKRA